MDEECSFVAHCIVTDIREEGLLPEDICVICVDQRHISDYYTSIERLLKGSGVKVFNMLIAPNANRRFSFEGHVTLATLNKAKGNETGMVYIVGADALFKYPNNVIARNKLFTAITRAKGWVVILGTGEDIMKVCKDELEKLKANDYKLVFSQPSEAQTRTVMAGSLKQQSKLKVLKESVEELKKLGMTEDDIFSVIHEK